MKACPECENRISGPVGLSTGQWCSHIIAGGVAVAKWSIKGTQVYGPGLFLSELLFEIEGELVPREKLEGLLLLL
jgi:hypothetical protein